MAGLDPSKVVDLKSMGVACNTSVARNTISIQAKMINGARDTS